jgi:hypothetical protein
MIHLINIPIIYNASSQPDRIKSMGFHLIGSDLTGSDEIDIIWSDNIPIIFNANIEVNFV